MNIKKIVSAITAFALSATMFAGFSVQAATDLDIGTPAFTATGGTADNAATIFEESCISHVQGGGSGNRTAYYNFTNASTADAVKVNFDVVLSSGSADSTFSIDQTVTTGNATASGAPVLQLFSTSWGGAVKLNGVDISSVLTITKGSGTTPFTDTKYGVTDWFNVDAIIDFKTGKIDATVTGTTSGKSMDVEADIMTAGATKISGFGSYLARALGGTAVKNMTVQELEYPAFTMSTDEVTVDSTTTTQTVTLTDVVGTVSVKSSDDTIATAEVADNTVTIGYVGNGAAEVTVTATNDGITTEEVIAVTSGSVAKTTVTVQYVNAADETEQLTTAATIADVPVGSSIDLTEYTDDVTEYTKNDIGYNATYDNTDVSSIEVTDGLVYKLKYTLTEKTYTGTIVAVPHAQVVVTGTSTSGETVNVTTNTDYANKTATVSVPEGTYAVATTKNGYSNGSAELVVTKDGGSVTVANVTATNADTLFYEDFDYAGGNGSYNLLGGYRQVSAGVMQTLWNGIKNNTSTFNFDAVSTTGTQIKLGSLYTKLGTADKNHSIAFNDATGAAMVTLLADGDATAPVLTISNGTDTVTLMSGEGNRTEDFVITFANGKATGTYNNVSFDLAVTDVNIASFTITVPNANSTAFQMTSIEAYKYVAPALTVATATPADFGDVAVATETVSAKAVTEGVLAETAEDVDLTDVTTVYIKVENVKDTSVMPAVVVGEETYAPTYKYEANSNGYFVYQFVGIDLTDAVVTYAGAADATL